MSVTIATIQDIPVLVSLLNSAYRGDASKKGWTTEADMIEGSLRTDETSLGELMQQPGAVILKYTDPDNKITGCVFLRKEDKKLYLGMLSVSPLIQAKGIGKQLMKAAEAYAAEQSCTSIYMRVISIRYELIAWYERKGYYNTGITQPFPNEPKFGIPKQPIEFILMQKDL
ncbi:MAG TPA: GNAT family N-acetyltransferase [Chitinophagaceae bacterium]|nr:GNAT family N-acetyltransferase [Chitinophagaceae bacterium]